MPPTMISLVPHAQTNAGVRFIRISLPMIECLIDNRRYWRPEDLPPPHGGDLQPMAQPKIGRERAAREKVARARAPTLRSLVKLALKCDSAEQLGAKLKARYERKADRKRNQAAGLAEIDRILDGES